MDSNDQQTGTVMTEPTDFIMIHTTTNNEDEAQKIAQTLLELRLASCIQINAVKSLYHWEGKICHDDEFLLLIKTQKAHYNEAEKQIKLIHSYQTPQILATTIIDGCPDYLKWIHQETQAPKTKD